MRNNFSGDTRMRNVTFCAVGFDFTRRFLPVVYIFVFIVGLIANGWGLNSLRQNWDKLRIINIFVLNLGVADVLYLLTLPFLVVYHLLNSQWIFGDVFCKVTRFCFKLNLYGSIGFLTCISVYRYLAIVHPVKWRGRITVTHTVVITIAVWVLVCIQCLPDIVLFPKTHMNTTGDCFDTTSADHVEDYLKYSLGWTLTGFCIPFLIILRCYGHVIVVLCTRRRTDEVQRKRSFRLLFILMVLFCVCYIPYHVVKNLHLLSRILIKQGACREWFSAVYVARQVTRGLACLNSVINPLIYLNGNEDLLKQLRQFNQRVRRVFNMRCSKTIKLNTVIEHF